MPSSPYSVEVRDLGKAYRRYTGRFGQTLGAMGLGRFARFQDAWVLRDVNLSVRPGAMLGICGANGAGKSTFLRLLAGISAPTAGGYRMHGSVGSILELGAGFHPAFSGRENVRMHAMLAGLSHRELMAKADEIIDFTELGAAIDEPLRTYSSGMAMRLGFSVAVAANPDVLLIDEVFAVGDIAFQKKCIDKITTFKERGTTVLLCSHSLYDLRQLCDEAIWIHDGRIAAHGDPAHVTGEYVTFQDRRMEGTDLRRDGVETELDDLPRVAAVEVWRVGGDGPVTEVQTGDAIELRVWWRNPHPERFRIHVGAGFTRQDRIFCCGTATHLGGPAPEGASGCAVLTVPNLPLLGGQYLIPVWILDEHGVHRHQEYVAPFELTVRTSAKELGVFLMESQWRHEDLPAPSTTEALRQP